MLVQICDSKIIFLQTTIDKCFSIVSSNLVTMFENEPQCLKCLEIMALD